MDEKLYKNEKKKSYFLQDEGFQCHCSKSAEFRIEMKSTPTQFGCRKRILFFLSLF